MNVKINKDVLGKLKEIIEPIKEHMDLEMLVNRWLDRDADIFLHFDNAEKPDINYIV